MAQHPNCLALWERAQQVLAGGPATLSKHPHRYPMGIAPMILTRGMDADVWCADGIKYLDTVAALGPILLGHNHAALREAIRWQSEELTSSTLSTPLETEVAEILTSIIPGAEMVRFACNGKDVTEAAVKLARYVTGKRHVIYVGYSGGYPDYLSTTDKDGGTLGILTAFNHQIAWRDGATLQGWLDGAWTRGRVTETTDLSDLAAIIVEVPPEAPDISKDDTTAVLRRYADAAHEAGALFLLDEIVTGLRYGLGGAQAYYGIQADLVTMSKALGNGYPISAILGPRDLMQAFDGGTCFLSTTFGASPIGLAAAKATLDTLMRTEALEHLALYGDAVYTHVAGELFYHKLPATVRGNFARFLVDWHGVEGIATAEELRTLWLQELVTRGMLAGVPWLPMCCYTSDTVTLITNAVTETCGVIQEVVVGQKAIGEVLTCPAITDVFAQRYTRHA